MMPILLTDMPFLIIKWIRHGKNWTLRLCSEAFLGKVVMFSLGGMKFEQEIPLKASCRKWDEEEGNVYTVHAQLLAGEQMLDQRKETFGIRIFGVDEGLRLTLNGRRFFLRKELLRHCLFFSEFRVQLCFHTMMYRV